MTCIEFRTAILESIERRRPPREAAAHLDECRDADCRACWDEAVLLDRAIERWRESAATRHPAVADAVVAAVQAGDGGLPAVASQPRVAGSRLTSGGSAAARRNSGSVGAVAAVAVVAAVLLVLFVDRPIDPERRAPAAADRGLGGDASVAYVAYAQDAAQIVTDAVVLTLGDSTEMEDPRIAAPRIGWEGTWTSIGEGMDAALEDLLDGPAAEAPHS